MEQTLQVLIMILSIALVTQLVMIKSLSKKTKDLEWKTDSLERLQFFDMIRIKNNKTKIRNLDNQLMQSEQIIKDTIKDLQKADESILTKLNTN